MDVYTLSGKKIALKEPALNAGGEGAVYELKDYPLKVAKIYHHASDACAREKKIKEMVKISETPFFRNLNLAQDIAWPLAPLFDEKHNFIGFGMNRIAARNELDDLYVYPPGRGGAVSIKHRLDCLISLCDVIGRLHCTGQIFGDFNPNNIKIKSDWTVNFVDADSYHIYRAGNVYRCIVCAPGYVAPELIRACKGTTYADYPGPTFTSETDYFALAIHCFRMLMNGCHPYTCQRQPKRVGSTPAPKSVDKRIEKGETPFFQNIPDYTTPSYAPDIHALPPYIYELFRRAFVDGHQDPKARPTASEWKSALEMFRGELQPCSHNHAHDYWKGNQSCPYCEADRRYSGKMSAFVTKPAPVERKKRIPPRNTTGKSAFKTITMVLSILLLVGMGHWVFPELYSSFTDNKTLVEIGVIGSCVSGFAGVLIYNRRWALGNTRGKYRWYEYLLSVLAALGFSVGFGVLMGIAMMVFAVLCYIGIALLIIGVIGAICSGG